MKRKMGCVFFGLGLIYGTSLPYRVQNLGDFNAQQRTTCSHYEKKKNFQNLNECSSILDLREMNNLSEIEISE